MNTSMTINATAPWLLALYIVAAERQGTARAALAGTVQNDLLKEYLSRGTYMLPPEPSLKLTCDVIAFAAAEMPKWNPINVCSYHLQEAGATPVQELAFTLANAIAVLDALRAGGQVAPDALAEVVGRISFFVNAGVRFVTEMCKMRAFGELWDEITRERYGVLDPKLRRFRYGVQVNSLGLTEQQPENNVYRILLSTLAVVLSRSARARAVQLPAWNEALGLPRPWDQQWSLRLQQILALGDRPARVRGPLRRLARDRGAGRGAEGGRARRARADRGAGRRAGGGRGRLHEAAAGRIRRRAPCGGRIGGAKSGRRELPLRQRAGSARGRGRLHGSRPGRRGGTGGARPGAPRRARSGSRRRRARCPARSRGARAATSWNPRSSAPAPASPPASGARCCARRSASTARRPGLPGLALPGAATTSPRSTPGSSRSRARLGRRPKMLIGKPGLDGHSNGAEQIAVCARDCGFEVVYDGIRLTPGRIANAALEEGVHVVGLSILSGAHGTLVREVLRRLADLGLGDLPVVVGGIIPAEDAAALRALGVARVFTPKDYALADVMAELVDLIEQSSDAAPVPAFA